jgi:predicted Fe-Mo cluster-binding NifX family protein
MIICVPTKTKEGKTAEVYGHFGSAPFFTLLDTESGTVEVIDNSNQQHAHGMCQPLSVFANRHIDVVVTGGMGARAVQKLNEGGVKAFRAIPGTVADIADQYARGGLEEITANNACAHHGGCH